MTINSYLQEKKQIVDEYLQTLLHSEGAYDAHITEAMRYSLLNGGKRLRAILALEVADALGTPKDKVLPFAAAIEMVHAYSLIHDDLPAMDDDDVRRGKPSNHIVYGEAIAILAGDALLNYAFEHMLKTTLDHVGDMGMLKATMHIAKSSGYRGMLGGQVIDIMSENKPIDMETVDFIHAHKTAKLIETSLVAGAYVAGADDTLAFEFTKFGYHLGMAFQIIDDILDIEGDEASLGKPIGADSEQGKATYPSILGLDDSKAAAKTHTERALAVLASMDIETAHLKHITDYLLNRTF